MGITGFDMDNQRIAMMHNQLLEQQNRIYLQLIQEIHEFRIAMESIFKMLNNEVPKNDG